MRHSLTVILSFAFIPLVLCACGESFYPAIPEKIADFKALKALLMNPGFIAQDYRSVPVLDRGAFPLADAKALHDCIKVGLCVVVHS